FCLEQEQVRFPTQIPQIFAPQRLVNEKLQPPDLASDDQFQAQNSFGQFQSPCSNASRHRSKHQTRRSLPKQSAQRAFPAENVEASADRSTWTLVLPPVLSPLHRG